MTQDRGEIWAQHAAACWFPHNSQNDKVKLEPGRKITISFWITLRYGLIDVFMVDQIGQKI